MSRRKKHFPRPKVAIKTGRKFKLIPVEEYEKSIKYFPSKMRWKIWDKIRGR